MMMLVTFLFSNFRLSKTPSSNTPFVVLHDFLYDYVVLQSLNFSGTKTSKMTEVFTNKFKIRGLLQMAVTSYIVFNA